MSIARLTFPSRLALKSLAGSCNEAPLAKVNFTLDLYDSPVQMIPSCAHTGMPIHFHSSTTSGSAALMSVRILLMVSSSNFHCLATRSGRRCCQGHVLESEHCVSFVTSPR